MTLPNLYHEDPEEYWKQQCKKRTARIVELERTMRWMVQYNLENNHAITTLRLFQERCAELLKGKEIR